MNALVLITTDVVWVGDIALGVTPLLGAPGALALPPVVEPNPEPTLAETPKPKPVMATRHQPNLAQPPVIRTLNMYPMAVVGRQLVRQTLRLPSLVRPLATPTPNMCLTEHVVKQLARQIPRPTKRFREQ